MGFETDFISPVSRQPLTFASGVFRNEHDSEIFPVIEDIPLLISNPKEHLDYIKNQVASPKGAWFSSSQVDSYDKGPYRHHLHKRRTCVNYSVKKYFESNTVKRPKFVDLGCGDGCSSRWVIEAAPPNSTFLLTDYSFDRLVKARKLIGEGPQYNYFLSDITNVPIPAETIDFVFSNHVIEHIPNDFGIFENAFSILKKGGKFLLGCPNEGVFWWMLAYALSPASIRSSDHIHFYNDDILIEMGTRAGFKRETVIHLGYGIPHWTLDALLRNIKLFDSLLHTFGKILFRKQSSCLYIEFIKT